MELEDLRKHILAVPEFAGFSHSQGHKRKWCHASVMSVLWGQFLTVALNFLIIAGVLFLAIKAINKLKKEEPSAPPPEPKRR